MFIVAIVDNDSNGNSNNASRLVLVLLKEISDNST